MQVQYLPPASMHIVNVVLFSLHVFHQGGQNEGGMRFRENQGPHPPAFNTQAATNSGPKIIKAENVR